MTIDEEFNRLEDDLRRLKVEYEVYFNGGSPRPPHDTLYRVENTIKRYSSDQSNLNFSQRFRFVNLAQRYAVNSNLWRRKLQEKEEGRSLTGAQKRPVEIPVTDGTVRVVCSDPDVETEKVSQPLQAMKEARKQVGKSADRIDAEFIKLQEKEEDRSLTDAQKRPAELPVDDGTVRVVFSDPDVETEKVSLLLQAMKEAMKRVGKNPDSLDAAVFHQNIRNRTKQRKNAWHCDKVQFSVSVEGGEVKFKVAKAE